MLRRLVDASYVAARDDAVTDAQVGFWLAELGSPALLAEVIARYPEALADRYRVDRELGQGGMATVYLGHDLRHDRDVSPDGKRFVMIRDRAKAGGRSVVKVENWFSELKTKVDGVKR